MKRQKIQPKDHAPGFEQLVRSILPGITEIAPDDLYSMLANHHDFVLLDVREDDEWRNGAIPNAIHIARGIVERDIEHAIPDKGREIVVYCGGGYRSALACDSLQKMGYENVKSLRDGYRGWVNAEIDREEQ